MPLSQPQRDATGDVIPHDHQDILGSDNVIRRIPLLWTVDDPKIGGRRITSLAFKASSGPNGGMSIDLETQIIESGQDPRTYVTTPHWIGSIILNVGNIRAIGFKVGYHPITIPPVNPHHGEVWGHFTKPNQKALRQCSQWFVPIPNVSIV